MSDPDACSCCGEPVAPTLPDGEWACGCEWEGCDENCPVVGYLYSAALDAEEHDHTEDIRHGIFAELPNRTSLRRRMTQWRDRAEAAEAEADRLREAIRAHHDGHAAASRIDDPLDRDLQHGALDAELWIALDRWDDTEDGDK